jgi:hypothetical protein
VESRPAPGSDPQVALAPEPASAEKTPPAKPLKPAQAPAKKGHASALRGAVIISQDGDRVSFRKKCTKCGHEDASKSAMPIRNGVTRQSYFCPKCRKLVPVEIQGTGK